MSTFLSKKYRNWKVRSMIFYGSGKNHTDLTGSRSVTRAVAVMLSLQVEEDKALPSMPEQNGLVGFWLRKNSWDTRPSGGRRAPKPKAGNCWSES